jgi:TusE/DsrC/DsvC family sulfur relay protein
VPSVFFDDKTSFFVGQRPILGEGMDTKIYPGSPISVDEDGCLVHFWDWTFEIGISVALELGVGLTPDHWKIINLAREDFAQHWRSPTLDELVVHCDSDSSVLAHLFPNAPETTIARIAGIPRLSR